MTKILAILILALLVEAVGVVCLSRGLKQLGGIELLSAREVGRIISQGATNHSILIGIVLETVFFGALLYLLSQREVSFIWPLTALGFVITALAARFILGEEITALRWTGVALIVVGAALVSWSEKSKASPPDALSTSTATSTQ